jgi:hypothetical protein
MLERQVPEETLNGMDADGLVHPASITRVLTRVIADAAVDRRQRIVADDYFPRLAKAPGLSFGEPGLDVFARGASVVARRQAVDI